MENLIKVFESTEFGQIRTAGTSGQPLFCLADVCKALGLKNPTVVKKSLNAPYLCSIKVGVQTGTKLDGTPAMQDVDMTFISEPNLYKCIFQSRKKEAEQFQDWVCNEVLPSIRKSGGYMVEKENESEDELMARALRVANDTLARRERRIRQLQAENKAVLVENENLKERQVYLDRILQSKSTMAVTQIAQDYGMSARRFNKILNEIGVQYKVKDQWILYAKYKSDGYIHSGTRDITNQKTGEVMTIVTTEWTQKGRLFLYRILKDRGIIPMIERNVLATA